MLPLLIALASAHDADFGLAELSVAKGNPLELWGTTRGWGIVHSSDGGATWQWYCEEGLGVSTLYDVDALDDGRALLAGVSGLEILAPDGTQTPLGGLPIGALVDQIQRYREGWLVAAYADQALGAYFCTLAGCAPTGLVGGDLYLKSFALEGDVVYATTVRAGSLVADLWRSPDGQSWDPVYQWADGTVDPRVLDVSGDRLLVWAQSRDADHTPALLRSADGGASWTSGLAFGSFTDDVPAMVRVGGGFWYLGNRTLHVYASIDDGATWTDINAYHPEIPSIRCVSDDGSWVCGDHFADGYDLARVNGFSFDAVTCLDSAVPAEAVAESCAVYYEDFVERGQYGGGKCTADLAPVETGGCGGGDTAVGVGALVGVAAAGRARRRRVR